MTRLLALALFYAPLAQAAELKLATWNLNWLTLRAAGDPALPPDVAHRDARDLARLRAYANTLDADIIAFQEVDGTAAASAIFDPARYQVAVIDEDVPQRVGLAVRRGILLRQNPDLAALDVEPPRAMHRLRYGLDATLATGGATFRLLAVHLKTGCHTDPLTPVFGEDCALLAAQVPVMARWVRRRAQEGVPFVILGDFNRVLDGGADALERALDEAAPLTRVTAGWADPCWGGGRFIDHIFLGGPARAWIEPGSLRVLTYREHNPKLREYLSDHCPVSVTFDTP